MTDEIDAQSLTDAELAAMMAEPDEAAEAPEPPPPAPAAEKPPEPPQAHTQVPLADLMEERGRRREAQARLEEMEARFREFQQRAAEAVKAQQPPTGVPSVDYDTDPIEYLRQQQAAVAANLEAMRRQQEELVQRQQAQAQFSALREQVGQSEAQFAKETPDYYDAVRHLREARAAELARRGLNEAQAQQVLRADALAVTQEAARLGLSPAQYAYRIAVGSGYTPRQGGAPARPSEAPKSLGGASGRADTATPSLNDLSKMSDKEFDKVFAKLMHGT